ncbi:hypothetical protein BC629DRAFT_1598054 [Irpex lacteus]|nr:hypothetical protein BC629DRAFT_1598054 [Irpex lacteus]
MSNQSADGGDSDDDGDDDIVYVGHGSRGRPIEIDDDDEVEYLGYSLPPGALPGGTYRTQLRTGQWIQVVLAEPTEEQLRRPRRYYGPDDEEASFPLPRPRPNTLEPLSRRHETVTHYDRHATDRSHFMVIPPGAKFGPPDRATREKRRDRRRATDGTSTTTTVSGPSTSSSGAGTSTTTRALDELTSEADDMDEIEEAEVVGELTRSCSTEGE